MYTIVHRLSSLVETGARASPASERQLPPSQPTRPSPPIAPVCHGSTHTALHPSEVNSHDFPFVCHLSRGLRTPLPHMPTRPRARDAIVGASLGCPLQEGEQESEAYINSGCNALPAAHPPSPCAAGSTYGSSHSWYTPVSGGCVLGIQHRHTSC